MRNVDIRSIPYATDETLSVLELLNDRSTTSAEPSDIATVARAALSLGRNEAMRWKIGRAHV